MVFVEEEGEAVGLTSSEGSSEGSIHSEEDTEVPVPPPLEDQFHSEEGTVQSSSLA